MVTWCPYNTYTDLCIACDKKITREFWSFLCIGGGRVWGNGGGSKWQHAWSVLMGCWEWGETIGPISRLELVVFDTVQRNASCDLENVDKELWFFCSTAQNLLFGKFSLFYMHSRYFIGTLTYARAQKLPFYQILDHTHTPTTQRHTHTRTHSHTHTHTHTHIRAQTHTYR